MTHRGHAGALPRSLLAGALVLVACGLEESPGFDRVVHLAPEATAEHSLAQAERVRVGGESRLAWRLSSGQVMELHAPIPEGGRLELFVALAPRPGPPARDVMAVLSLREPTGESRVLMRQPVAADPIWQPLFTELAAQSGQDVVLELGFEAPADEIDVVGLVGEVLLLQPDTRPRPPNIVLVTLDTTRADVARDSAVAPHLAALAARGIDFSDAWSPATTTSPAHASILTGLPVEQHGMASNRSRLGEEQITLAEVLRDLGYQTAASVSAPHLGPKVGFAQGFDRFRPAEPGDGADGRHALEPVLGWLSRFAEDGSRPFFVWLHLFDAHTPYGPPASFVHGEWAERGFVVPGPDADPPTFPVFAGGPPVPLDWLLGVTSRAYVDALYRAGVGYADHLLGGLLAALEASGEAERTIVVVTADHGEALGEQDIWYQHAGLFPASLRVPLVIALPGGPHGITSDARVSTLDIAPTLLRAVTGAGPSAPGQSLLDTLSDPDRTRRVWFAEADLDLLGFRDAEVLFALALRPGQYGVRVDRRDGIPRVVGVHRYRPETSWLFDVNADPDLEHDLADDPGAGTARYRELVRSRAADSAGRIQQRALSAEEEAKLRSLGYLGEAQ